MKPWEYCASFFGSYYTLFIVIVGNISIFIIGVSTAWSSPVLVKLNGTEDNPLGRSITAEQSDLIASLMFVGGALGPISMMRSVQRFGRKRTILIANLPCLVGYVMLLFAKRVELFYVARILIGFTMGSVGSIFPAYLSEICLSVENRGPYMAIGSPAMQLGILASYVIGPYISLFKFNCFILCLSLLGTLLLAYGCPESPNFIIEKKGRSATMRILKKLETENAEKELLQMENDIVDETEKSFLSIFKSMQNLKPFIMATMLLYLQQLSGIGVLLTYSQQIFLKSNINLPSEHCSIIVGVIQVVSATAITITAKKFRRKSLLIFSLFGSAIFDLILGCYFHFEDGLTKFNWIPLIALILFMICFNSGLDPIPWVYLGELYPPQIKTVGIAASVTCAWIGLYVITYAFSKVELSYSFFGFAIFCLFGIIYVKFKLTETKGKTLGEIQEAMCDNQ